MNFKSGNRIFLAGGGNEFESEAIDQAFARTIKRKLLYLPTAQAEVKHAQSFNWFLNAFSKYRLPEIEMRSNLSELRADYLAGVDGIYIGGGNTFQLMAAIRESAFGGLLNEFVHSGGSLYGGSAGAIILGSSIESALRCDPNDVNLDNFNGLSLCGGFAVWCHYRIEDDPNIKLLVRRGIQVLALPETSGVSYLPRESLTISDFTVHGTTSFAFTQNGKIALPFA